MGDESQTTDHASIPAPDEVTHKPLGNLPIQQQSDSPDRLIYSPDHGPCAGSVHLKDYAEHLHAYVREYISVADRKASFAFAVGAALLVYLFEIGGTAAWMTSVRYWKLSDGVAFIASIGLFASLVLAVSVVFPRTVGAKGGFVFWKSIAAFPSAAEFSEAASELGEARIVDEMLRHSYDLSRVCRAKYRVLNWSIRVGTVSGVAAILYLFL